MADPQHLLKAIDVLLACVQLDEDAQAVRVSDGAQQFGQLFGDEGSSGNRKPSLA
ncbi:MAG: hypothetical protein ACOYX1_03770 [Acidobacteriota bacterium]